MLTKYFKMTACRKYIVPFTLYLIILPKKYTHGIFAARRALVPTQEKKLVAGRAIAPTQEKNCPTISGKETTGHHAQTLKLSFLQ